MIYFEVDVDMDAKIRTEADIPDFVNYFDGRLFRTDGTILEGMFVLEDDSITWKAIE